VALDQQNGWERWELHNLDLIVWAGDDRFVASAAAADYRGGLAYDLLGVDAATGATVWTDPMSAPLRSSLLGSENTRLVVQDPHSAIGTVRLRQLDAIDGSVEWEINTTERYDGATVDESGVARVYRLNRTFDGPRGELHTVRGTQDVHTLHTPDGITQSPLITEHGMIVISGESSVSCAGRQIASAEGT
jgi:outer membrane protein assembly factor BamB